MNVAKKQFIKLLLTAILMAAGIILVLFASIHYNNVYPMLSVLMIVMAIFFPTTCGGCNIVGQSGTEAFLFDDMADYNMGAKLAWVLAGCFIVLGYAVIIELFRGHYIPATAVYVSLSGDTVIMVATLIFVKIIYFSGERDAGEI